MAPLRYSVIASLDGYTVDADGKFDWAEPATDVLEHVNEQERPIGTYLYGRRMYDTMKVWQTFGTRSSEPEVIREYGEIWRSADKVVYSAGLAAVQTPKTRLERRFDPDEVRAVKAAADAPVTIGGATIGATALRAGLVDELAIYVVPAVVGGGTGWLPDGLRLRLDLRDEHRFASGIAYLHYSVHPWSS
jgi:dihydrofolate reductase